MNIEAFVLSIISSALITLIAVAAVIAFGVCQHMRKRRG